MSLASVHDHHLSLHFPPRNPCETGAHIRNLVTTILIIQFTFGRGRSSLLIHSSILPSPEYGWRLHITAHRKTQIKLLYLFADRIRWTGRCGSRSESFRTRRSHRIYAPVSPSLAGAGLLFVHNSDLRGACCLPAGLGHREKFALPYFA